MGITISGQTGLLISAALLGFVLGGLYDVFRFIRVATGCGRVALIFLDIIYWLICSVATFIFILLQNEGKIRFLVLFTEALGAGLYYCTIGAIFIKRAEAIDRAVKKHAKQAGRAVMKPVHKYGSAAFARMSSSCKKAYRNIKKDSKLLKIRLKVKSKMMYNLLRPAKKPKPHKK